MTSWRPRLARIAHLKRGGGGGRNVYHKTKCSKEIRKGSVSRGFGIEALAGAFLGAYILCITILPFDSLEEGPGEAWGRH